MKHLLIPARAEPGDTIRLGTDDRHYLVDVLRLKTGESFEVLDSDGRLRRATLTRIRDQHLEARIDETHQAAGDGMWTGRITIWQAMPKGRKTDEILRAVIQAGATRFVPIITERTIVQSRGDESARRTRWERIAREAVQQCGATTPVVVDPIRRIDQLENSADVSLFLHPAPLAQQSLHGYLDRVPEHVELVVGPEGGFSDRETGLLSDRGFRPLFLGPRVLRTETAAVFAMGAVQILLQEHAAWRLTETRPS